MQGKLYKRIRMLLRYTAGTGLFNQQYSHISAIALASVLGAELILPPGVHPSISDNEYRFVLMDWRCVCTDSELFAKQVCTSAGS